MNARQFLASAARLAGRHGARHGLALRLRTWARPLAQIQAADALAGLVALALGWGVGSWFWQDEAEDLERARHALQVLQGRLASAHRSPASAPGAPAFAPAIPVAGLAGWLSEGLQSHGLQVLALRPGVTAQHEGLISLPLTLELQGRWHDWWAFERQWAAHTGGWTTEQWQMTASAGDADEGRLVWQLRLDGRVMQEVAPLRRPDGSRPVATRTVQGPGTPVTPGAAVSAPWRLYGTWSQAGVWHAVLGHGEQQWRVVSGQRLGSSGVKVLQVGPTSVRLQPDDAGTGFVHLTLMGETRR